MIQNLATENAPRGKLYIADRRAYRRTQSPSCQVPAYAYATPWYHPNNSSSETAIVSLSKQVTMIPHGRRVLTGHSTATTN